MSAFELKDNECNNIGDDNINDLRRLREECIIAFKVYDFCRQQDCCLPDELGPARAAEDTCIGGKHIHEGDVIDPPNEAAAVTIDKLKIKKILIIGKEPSPFRNGFWDIDLKYVFEYRLTFREADGTILGSLKANNIYNKKVTLFGSIGSDLIISTDLLCSHNETTTLDSDPYVLVEAKAVALSAEIRYARCCNHQPRVGGIQRPSDAPEANEIAVTIGLFTIIKLFRVVNLSVESRGFCIPQECEDISPLNPCDFFDNLDFPMDIFAPPQKPEFFAGISNNIPHENQNNHKNCGCHKHKDCTCSKNI